jgi:ribosome-binding protein aMBF1 (putative translation factor)
LQLTTSSESPEFKRFITSPVPTSGGAQIISIESAYIHALMPDGYKEIDSLIQEREKNPTRARALARARQRLANKMVGYTDIITLASLRLRAGLSQHGLAEKIGNSQPSYSKIEAGKTEIMHSTYEKLVEVLDVSRDELSQAIKNTQKELKQSA